MNQPEIKNATLSSLSPPHLQHWHFPFKTQSKNNKNIFPHGLLGLNLIKCESVKKMCLFEGLSCEKVWQLLTRKCHRSLTLKTETIREQIKTERWSWRHGFWALNMHHPLQVCLLSTQRRTSCVTRNLNRLKWWSAETLITAWIRLYIRHHFKFDCFLYSRCFMCPIEKHGITVFSCYFTPAQQSWNPSVSKLGPWHSHNLWCLYYWNV